MICANTPRLYLILQKHVILNNNFTFWKARGKGALSDVNYYNCYSKMTSVLTLDGVTLFLPMKGVTNFYP